MKRTLLAALIFALSTATPSAQAPKKQAPATGSIRVAVVNLGYVFNSFGGSRFKSAPEQTLSAQKEKAQKITILINGLEEALRTRDLTPAKAEEYREKILEERRRLNEINRELSSELGKRQEENMIAIWKEVQEAIKTYARQNEIDLVFGYGEPTEKEMLNQFPNVNRKMEAMDLGGAAPLFVSSRVDISQPIVELLNKQRRDKNSK